MIRTCPLCGWSLEEHRSDQKVCNDCWVDMCIAIARRERTIYSIWQEVEILNYSTIRVKVLMLTKDARYSRVLEKHREYNASHKQEKREYNRRYYQENKREIKATL